MNSSSETSRELYPFNDASGKYGYVDIEGNIVIEPKFYHASVFGSNGYASVMVDRERYNMNKKGELSPKTFDYTYGNEIGPKLFHDIKKYGYVDNQDNLVIEAKFDYANSFFGAELASVKIDGKSGYINKEKSSLT